VCSYTPSPGAGGSLGQAMVVLVYAGAVMGVASWVYGHPTASRLVVDQNASTLSDPAEQERCKVPEFAKKIGHEQQWKLHNGCQ